MDNENSCNDPCPIARSLVFAGDAWSILILRDAHAGLTRFDQFRKSLGIAPTMLTRRLATLTDDKQRVIALQPISQKEDATRLCIETCIARNWRLSMQTHKYLNIA